MTMLAVPINAKAPKALVDAVNLANIDQTDLEYNASIADTVAEIQSTALSLVPASGTIIVPSATDQIVPKNYYDGTIESGKVLAVVVPAANVKTGITIAGVPGTMPVAGSQTATITTQNGTKVIPAGYTDGGTITAILPPASDVVIVPSAVDQVIPANYYDGTVASGIVRGLVSTPGAILLITGGLANGGVNTTMIDTKLGEITVNARGVYTVSFYIMCPSAPYLGYGQIRVNDIPVGIPRSGTDAGYTFTEDITVNAGDKIQVYGYVADAGYQITIANFELYTGTPPIVITGWSSY